MGVFADILKLAGSLICHQLPERTIYAGEMPLPLCARDTGIYLGVLTVMLFSLLLRRMDSDSQPRLPYAILLCLMMLPMMVDGAGSYLGFFSTNNTVRLFTGVLFGMPLGVFLIPAANFKITEANNNRLLRSPLELAGILAAGLLTSMAVLKGLLPWILPSSAIIASMLFLIGRLVYTIIKHVSKRRGDGILLKTVSVTAGTVLVMYLVSNYIIKPAGYILFKIFG